MTTLTSLRETASQTAGPYVHIGLAPKAAGFDIFENNFGNVLVTPATQGERILVELWQANAQGRYAHPADRQAAGAPDAAFRGWGRACSDFETGVFTFETIKPGTVAGRGGMPMAPHLNLWIAARGINIGLHTRMYFDDEAQANAADPVLKMIEWEVRRKTLVAKKEQRGAIAVYRFDIRLQGEAETVFFDI